MTRLCDICGYPIKHDDPVIVGLRSTFVNIPSPVAWAIEKSTDYKFIYHEACDNWGF